MADESEFEYVEAEHTGSVHISGAAAIRKYFDKIDTPVWCPVANMTRERPYGVGSEITKRGSRHFAPGAKLYFHRVVGYSGRGGDPQVEVVGRHRGSHRYATMIVSLSWLENWRVDLVYSPHVARELFGIWDGTPQSKAQAESYVQKFLGRTS